VTQAAHAHTALDEPSKWVVRFAPLIAHGEVLDLACGGGRHSRLLASLGYQVLAADRDPEALKRCEGSSIATLRVDLENGSGPQTTWPFAANRFMGIVVTNYLYRPLFPRIFSSLAPNGVLIYETFAQGNERYGKPSNPDFLLAPGELLEAVGKAASRFRVIAYEDGLVTTPKAAMVQRICAVKEQIDSLERLHLP
jgi:SAM-dependent methyltransferase